MANQEEFFVNLSDQIGTLSNAIGAQGVAQVVSPYDGDPSTFKEWVKSIDKYAVLANIPAPRVKLIAYQTSRGTVSDFISRYLNDNPGDNWTTLKGELALRFAEVTDSSHAFMLLRKLKQKPRESVQVFAERLLSLAEEAYQNMGDGAQAAIEAQLIGFFIDGLNENYLKMKVMRDNPRNFRLAVATAMNEQNLHKRFSLRVGERQDKRVNDRVEEPMDVDHVRPKRFQGQCYHCHKTGHRAKDCTKQINAVSKGDSKACWFCGETGHFKRDCPKRMNKGLN